METGQYSSLRVLSRHRHGLLHAHGEATGTARYFFSTTTRPSALTNTRYRLPSWQEAM